MDGVEVMTHGHLLDQFISPLTNGLEGPYGGDLAARMKLTMDIIEAVRARVGREFIVGVRFTVTERLKGIQRDGNRLTVTLGTDYLDFTREAAYDQVVVNYGTMPMDDLYFDLKELSSNRGEVDHDALIDGRPLTIRINPDGRFQLFRIGDAVSARNTHAAIYDALRLVKDL